MIGKAMARMVVAAWSLVAAAAWANGPTSFRYQWYRCDNPGKTNCGPIGGATSKKYRLVTADAGHTTYAAVTACNGDGCGTTATDPRGPIPPRCKRTSSDSYASTARTSAPAASTRPSGASPSCAAAPARTRARPGWITIPASAMATPTR